MQYTAKKPLNSVLILQPDTFRYRYEEDQIFKEIRYEQVTNIKVKSDQYRNFIFILAPFLIIGDLYHIYDEGFNWINFSNALVWFTMLCVNLGMKKVYFVRVIKGPLTAEVFATHSHKEANSIKTAIELCCQDVGGKS